MAKQTEKRAVSKRTKRLFIGFGAVSIATIAILYRNYPNFWQPAQTSAAHAPVAHRAAK